MINKNLITVSVAIAVFMLGSALAAVAAVPVYADNGFTTDCTGPGNSGNAGDCEGGSEGSGPHDETVTNRGGNQPPGQQEDDD